jgi:hypothetical protein
MRFSLPRDPFSLVGTILTTIGGVLFVVFFFLDLVGLHTNPYMGIVFFMVLPTIFIIGLLLIPVGVWRERRRRLAGKPSAPPWPRLDLNDPRQRSWVALIAAATVVNVVIVSLAAYSGVEYMDSVKFCGQVCHTVMKPEFTAHENGPHARVACVQCHIGPGAGWFVRSKLSGARQVLAVTFHTYERPIPSPVQNLRPARETCEECHWPDKFQGDITRIVHNYADDEKNTDTPVTLALHVGGGDGPGIHWHVSAGTKVEYIATDDKRQVIPWVRLTKADGTVQVFAVDGVSQAALDKGEHRTMDCVDCHNRPAHTFDANADKAVNRALGSGLIPVSLPFIKREAARVLTATYASQDAANGAIEKGLTDFYRAQFAQAFASHESEVKQAVTGVQGLYDLNVFPAMNVTWSSYPNNIGHADFPGCFRCHDGNHNTKDGKTISQACDLCHDIK